MKSLQGRQSRQTREEMSIAFLNGDYLALETVRISPMDRGFLFGDGIYELIPVHNGNPIGFNLHIDRMKDNLSAVEINLDWTHDQWRKICNKLVDKNGAGNLAIYLQVSRGVDTKRHHAYPEGITPTVFGFTSGITTSQENDRTMVVPMKISSAKDRRWHHCNIKSTALLGNVIHFQQGQSEGNDETLLFNAADKVTEASTSNVFVIKDGVVMTPLLNNQVLPGITRLMLIDMLRKDGSIPIEECVVTMSQVRDADEIWLSSSTKEVVPVIALDGNPIGNGEVGPLWEIAHRLFIERKFDY
jgi:D-alanine transaminase